MSVTLLAHSATSAGWSPRRRIGCNSPARLQTRGARTTLTDEEATRRRQHRWEARELTATLLTHIQPLTARRAIGDVIYADEVRDAQAMRG